MYERVEKSVISVVKKAQKSEQTLFMAVKKSRKRTDLFIFLRLQLHHLKGMQSSKLGMWKGCHLLIEGERNGYLFSQKWYIKG